jgi:hypothetical protein
MCFIIYDMQDIQRYSIVEKEKYSRYRLETHRICKI